MRFSRRLRQALHGIGRTLIASREALAQFGHRPAD
jgi:hypothetical protein